MGPCCAGFVSRLFRVICETVSSARQALAHRHVAVMACGPR